jgi:hypothetical protein
VVGLPRTESDLFAILAGLALGIGGIGLGWAFTTGRYRAPARYYWNVDLPWYIRNGPFAMFPVGVMFICGVGLLVVQYLPATLHVAAVGLLTVGFLGSFLVAVAWTRRPPQSLKPQWLRIQQDQRKAPGATPGLAGVFDRILATFVVGTVVVVLAIVVLATILALLGQGIGV